MDYLTARGLDSLAGSARLGYVREPLPGDERFTGRISIPYRTASGVVGLKFRAISDEAQPKYDGPAGQATRLFNVVAVTENDGDSIVVCEGEIDALVMHHLVGLPAVGVPGVSAWKSHYRRIFADFPVVYVVTDNDVKEDDVNPGRDLADRIMKDLSAAVHISPPAGMDVNEWFLSVGADGVREAMGVAA